MLDEFDMSRMFDIRAGITGSYPSMGVGGFPEFSSLFLQNDGLRKVCP